jgi:hypothetical protein
MPPSPPGSRDVPLDGRAVFDATSSVAGLTAGWEPVRENAGSAGGDGQTIDSFAAQPDSRIASLSGALPDGPLRIALMVADKFLDLFQMFAERHPDESQSAAHGGLSSDF